jgi:NAD(P)-dependent dehydrogenase (short-subunit alcohol dehydrogenase family)
MLKLQNCVALVTGSNRGLGLAYCEGLLRAGAAKVYAAARDPSKVGISDSRIVPVALDVTSIADVISAAHNCQDTSLLINNAGVLRSSPMLGIETESAARQEMETNYFGVLSMAQRFAPILARAGGGAIVNVLSVASWFTNPFMATYCASKAAEEVLTDAIRIQLRSQQTQVVGVYAGYIDTDMAAHITQSKTSPIQVVMRTLAGLESGIDRIFADDRAVQIDQRIRTDRAALDAELQKRWEEAQSLT